ncbi:winged helix-turn-helix domain-containing protein [Enterococcus sp. CWB-B31]|uniref:winged helix-turn-helix domain-containing protein n=1 Tax=Enterococcus sp. CWB-B31 TaxID=2885159 RepID=UPI001E54F906|nr:winged helix-turn-helix domain-containing protein [Enterococcus sp. CWB-B31]MCB5953438.1 winged helix-turn-helix domain-containing protein [Enterococcus sp. CWB-B31]
MYNIGVNHSAKEFESTYIENIEKNRYNVLQVDNENMDKVVDNLDGVVLKEDSDQNIGVICGLIMKIKEKSNPLIWVLSDQPSALQKVLYLQLGVDGTFTSETAPEEVNLIIRNSLNRYQKVKSKSTKPEIEKGLGIELLPYNLSIKLEATQQEIPLTKLEFQLMKLLYDNLHVGVSYKEIYEYVWQKPYKNNKYRVANLVFHLRSKLEGAEVESVVIRTVRSKGYMLSA